MKAGDVKVAVRLDRRPLIAGLRAMAAQLERQALDLEHQQLVEDREAETRAAEPGTVATWVEPVRLPGGIRTGSGERPPSSLAHLADHVVDC